MGELVLELKKLPGNRRLYDKLTDCSRGVSHRVTYFIISAARFRKKMYLPDIWRVSIDLLFAHIYAALKFSKMEILE